MNIFVLDLDVDKCAEYHCDKHVVKMILETTQLLNNALIKNDSAYNPVYKQTHKNHPCSIWASENRANFEWLVNLGLALCSEYTLRYNKTHKCQPIIESFKKMSSRLPAGNLTEFNKCMPDEYKTNDVVESYRKYYKGDKVAIAKWKSGSKPYWM